MSSKSRSKGSAIKAVSSPKRNPLTLRFIGEEFVFDTVTGMFYIVSQTAAFIVRALDAGTPQERLADEVQRRYGIDRATAVRDIEQLLDDLAAIVSRGLVRA